MLVGKPKRKIFNPEMKKFGISCKMFLGSALKDINVSFNINERRMNDCRKKKKRRMIADQLYTKII